MSDPKPDDESINRKVAEKIEGKSKSEIFILGVHMGVRWAVNVLSVLEDYVADECVGNNDGKPLSTRIEENGLDNAPDLWQRFHSIEALNDVLKASGIPRVLDDLRNRSPIVDYLESTMHEIEENDQDEK